jgi:hypothetical protein
MSRLALLGVLALSVLSNTACSSAEGDNPSTDDSNEIVSGKVDDHWFYSGALPKLDNPQVTVSITGHTAHVTGTLPAGTQLPSDLPHVKTKIVGGKTQIDIVYPIATAKPGKTNSRPGTYEFYEVKPYRPNGQAFTQSEGWHQVPWGGFPFIAYNNGIAFHGPITDRDNEAPGDLNVWYLRRGTVSAGCNRMLGEHVIELAHVLGISMRKIYEPNKGYRPTTTAKVKVISDYDQYDGKFIDVDYPTDEGARRPGAVHGTDRVVMFGSWVLKESPNGKDLPPDMKWEGGVSGVLYDFNAHAKSDPVCSMPKTALSDLKAVAARTGGELPANFCAKKRACDARVGRVCKVSELGL